MKTEELLQSRNNPLVLTPLELDLMKVVWQRHPLTVKDVHVAIRNRRSLAYTTVMTVLHRLYLKGFLQRSLKSRTHFYEPAVDFTDVRDAAVAAIVTQFFEGSRDGLLRFLANDNPQEAADDPQEPAMERSGSTSLDETLL